MSSTLTPLVLFIIRQYLSTYLSRFFTYIPSNLLFISCKKNAWLALELDPVLILETSTCHESSFSTRLAESFETSVCAPTFGLLHEVERVHCTLSAHRRYLSTVLPTCRCSDSLSIPISIQPSIFQAERQEDRAGKTGETLFIITGSQTVRLSGLLSVIK